MSSLKRHLTRNCQQYLTSQCYGVTEKVPLRVCTREFCPSAVSSFERRLDHESLDLSVTPFMSSWTFEVVGPHWLKKQIIEMSLWRVDLVPGPLLTVSLRFLDGTSEQLSPTIHFHPVMPWHKASKQEWINSKTSSKDVCPPLPPKHWDKGLCHNNRLPLLLLMLNQ